MHSPSLLILLLLSACIGPRIVSTPLVNSTSNTPPVAETAALESSPTPVSALASATSVLSGSGNVESTLVGVATVATRNTYYVGLGPQMSQPCHLLYDGDILRLDPNNCPLRLTLTDRVGVIRYFGIRGSPGNFSIAPDLPAYRKPGFALLACPVLQYDDNICQYALTDESGTYRLEIRVTGVE